ncbi:hypothetical protein VTJ83DRAFT_7492 [Remersonia thermophila]|uniref:RING-type domain-containing protein n=1 Tax=Remersonia thermophila TaxID=72144 RepID=A0ABR4D3N5_9PEZI
MTETCRACGNPLVLTLDPDDSSSEAECHSVHETTTVPDDLHLPCDCHFHWQCLLDQATSILSTLTCPACRQPLTTGGAAASSSSSSSSSSPPQLQILTTYTNEGGIQPSLDLYPTLLEESFLSSHPEARPARAFHTMTAEGDTQGMLALLADFSEAADDGDGDGDGDAAHQEEAAPAPTPQQAAQQRQKLLAWRDPLNGHRTALHVALESRQEEAVWLLLWVGSGIATAEFPEAVVSAARGNHVPRTIDDASLEDDVRFLKDGEGRTPADVCLQLGEPWTKLVEGGLFTAWS